MVANIALHGYCFYNLTQGCFQRSTGILLITWTHFKNLNVRLGRPTNWMQRRDHAASLNRGLSRKSEQVWLTKQ